MSADRTLGRGAVLSPLDAAFLRLESASSPRDASVDRDVAAVGYTHELMWSVDSLGWRGAVPDEVRRRVLAAAEPGAIVLMHVGAASTDALALPGLLRELRSRGFSFVHADGF